jgi:hypothetical protein
MLMEKEQLHMITTQPTHNNTAETDQALQRLIHDFQLETPRTIPACWDVNDLGSRAAQAGSSQNSPSAVEVAPDQELSAPLPVFELTGWHSSGLYTYAAY